MHVKADDLFYFKKEIFRAQCRLFQVDLLK